jgi:hypothetical protein
MMITAAPRRALGIFDPRALRSHLKRAIIHLLFTDPGSGSCLPLGGYKEHQE